MTSSHLPSYTELAETVNKTGLSMHVSQIHGILCGILCGDLHQTIAWETLLAKGAQVDVARGLLQSLYDVSAEQLKEFLFELQLLLPSDAEGLPERAEALTLWCQGLLIGLKLTNVPIKGREASDLTEAIQDIVEIAKMNYEEVIANEEDEVAYSDLVEYVRMAVILIYQDLREGSHHDRHE